MELNWIFFGPALLLLFFPVIERGAARVRLCGYEDIRNNRDGIAGVFWRQPWVWVDPIRAFAGAWLLRNAWTLEASLSGVWKHVPLAATFLILALAVGSQMHTRREEEVVFAPIGYVSGLMFATLPPQVAVLVVALAGACMMAFRGWGSFFFCGAFAAAVFGYMILRVDLWMAGTVALLIEPLFLALLFGRSLVVPVTGLRRRTEKRRVVVRPAEHVLEVSR